AACAGVRDLHLATAPSAAHQSLQQRASLACGAAALPARGHVRSQPCSGREVLIPADIARMVIGQADRPLLDRDINSADTHLIVLVDTLDLPLAAIHERDE